MILFLNQSTGKIVSDTVNSIPIEITTDVVIFDTEDSDITVHEMSDGKYVYLDSDGKDTFESESIITGDEIDFTNIYSFGSKSELDEKIYSSTIVENTAKMVTTKLLHDITITKENAIDYDIDDILSSEFSNILEESGYDHCSYDILEDVILDTSDYVSYNKYRLLMDTQDIVYLTIPNLTINSKIIIRNIPSGVDVYMNNNKLVVDNNNDLSFETSLINTDLNIQLVNNNAQFTAIINPYILYS